MAEGRKFDFPTMMTDDEIERLGVLISKVDRPMQLPLPRYATDIMLPDLTDEEALQWALQNSAPQLPPLTPRPSPAYNPWAAPPPPPPWAALPPPPPPAALAYVPSVANSSFVVLDDDEEEE
jgi:hypothetical protein